MAILSKAERASALSELPGWSYDPEREGIARRFRFADFNTAFAFMARVALAAEKADHHPDWSNAWNRVEVLLRTHDAGGVTAKDIALAGEMNRLAAQLAEPGSAD